MWAERVVAMSHAPHRAAGPSWPCTRVVWRCWPSGDPVRSPRWRPRVERGRHAMGRHELSTALRLTGRETVECRLGLSALWVRGRVTHVGRVSGPCGLVSDSRRRPGDALRIACSP